MTFKEFKGAVDLITSHHIKVHNVSISMRTLKYPINKAQSLNVEALNELVNKHQKINKLFEEGKAIDPQLTKNFVTFPISDNPFGKYDKQGRLINVLWGHILTEEGLDWFNWFMYEKDGISGKPKKDMKANDGGKEILKDLKGLYNYLTTQKYFKVND